MSSCAISRNGADHGGGICGDQYASPTIASCTIVENFAMGTYGAGGGIYYDWYSAYLIITN